MIFFIGERFFSACSHKKCRYEILGKLFWGCQKEMPKAVSTRPKYSVKYFHKIGYGAKNNRASNF